MVEKLSISEILNNTEVPANPAANPPIADFPEGSKIGSTFQIKNAKLYVPVVTLSINDNIKFLESIKLGFKRTTFWNKYKSKITTQPKVNNLDYMIDPTFRNITRLFVLSFKNGNDDPTDSFDKYYMPLVKIKNLMH